MTEINYILTTMTDRSLIIIDELCRSTSLEEGTAVAMAVCEELARSKAYTYITTHFTLLTKLYDLFFNLKVWQLETIPSGDPSNPKTMKLDFKFSLTPGVTTLKGYGIYMVRGIWPEDVMKHVDEIQQTFCENNKDQTFHTLDKRARLKYNLLCKFKKLNAQKKATLSNMNEYLQQYEKEMQDIDEDCRKFSEEFSQRIMEQIERESEVNRQMRPLDHSIFDTQDQQNGYSDITVDEQSQIFLDDLNETQCPNVIGFTEPADNIRHEDLPSNPEMMLPMTIPTQASRQQMMEIFTPDSKLGLCDSDVSQLTIEPDIYMNLDTTYESQCKLNFTEMALGLDNAQTGRDVAEKPLVPDYFDNFQEQQEDFHPNSYENLETCLANISPIPHQDNVTDVAIKPVPPDAPKASPFVRFFARPLLTDERRTSTPILTKLQDNAKNFGTSSSINVTSPNGQNLTKITTPKISFTLPPNLPEDLDINSLAEDLESLADDIQRDGDEACDEIEELEVHPYKSHYIPSDRAANNEKHIFPRVRILVGPNEPSEEDIRSNISELGRGVVVRPVAKGQVGESIRKMAESLNEINIQVTQDTNVEENDQEECSSHEREELAIQEETEILIKAFNTLSNPKPAQSEEAFNTLSNPKPVQSEETMNKDISSNNIYYQISGSLSKLVSDINRTQNIKEKNYATIAEPREFESDPMQIEEMIKAFNKASEGSDQINQGNINSIAIREEEHTNEKSDAIYINKIVKNLDTRVDLKNQEPYESRKLDQETPINLSDRASEENEQRGKVSGDPISFIALEPQHIKQTADIFIKKSQEKVVFKENIVIEDTSSKENYLQNADSQGEDYHTANSNDYFSYSPLVPKSQDKPNNVEKSKELNQNPKNNENDLDWDKETVQLCPSVTNLDEEGSQTQEYRGPDQLTVQAPSKVEIVLDPYPDELSFINIKNLPRKKGLSKSSSGEDLIDENRSPDIFGDNYNDSTTNIPVETLVKSGNKIEIHENVLLKGPAEKIHLSEVSFDTCNTTYFFDCSIDKNDLKKVIKNQPRDNQKGQFCDELPKSAELTTTTAENSLSISENKAKTSTEKSPLVVKRKPSLGMRLNSMLNRNNKASAKRPSTAPPGDLFDNNPSKKLKSSSGTSSSPKSAETKDKTVVTGVSEASRLRNLEGGSTSTSSSKPGNSERLSDLSRKRNLDEKVTSSSNSLHKPQLFNTRSTNKEGSSDADKKKPPKKRVFQKFKAPLKKSNEDFTKKKNVYRSSSDEIISAVEDNTKSKKTLSSWTSNPSKLSQKAIRSEFQEQDKRFFEAIDTSGSSVDLAKLWEERMTRPPRPTPKQIQQTTCVATIRKTHEGVEVIPSDSQKPRNSKIKSNNSWLFQPHPMINMNIFSDQNADTFDEFIKSKSNDYKMFNFNLEYGQKTANSQENMFDFKQVRTASSEYTQNSQSWTFVRKTQEDQGSSSNQNTNFQFKSGFLTFENNSTSQNSTRDHRNDV